MAGLTDRQGKHRLAWPEAGVSRVPFAIYSDPVLYTEEQQRLFRGPVWNFVGLEQEIPRPGDFRTLWIGDTPVVAVRDGDGEVNVLVNRCAHRGNLVCIQARGSAERLTCVYHNWSYDLKGRLLSVAFRHGVRNRGGMPADFDPAEHPMPRLRTETFCGLVFATFSDRVEGLSDYLGPEMCANIERVLGRPMTVLGTHAQFMPNNWKLYMENVRDSYHASLLHLFQSTFPINRLSMDGGIKLGHEGWHHLSYAIEATDRQEAQYNAKDLRAYKEGYRLADDSIFDNWSEYACGTTLAIQTVFPNFVVQQIQNSIALRLCLPKGPGDCELQWWILGAADDTEEQRRIRIRQSNLIGPSGLISMEDGVVGGWVQRATRNDPEAASFVEMGGRDVAPSQDSRATEVAIRGFWSAYRALMDL